jgi:hypothetical protein
MYLNGYEILITAPNEGLLYLPLIKSRVPVEWDNLTVYKNDEEDYGCVTEGEARMQGSVTGAIGRDLHRQVMALLTQGPGQWSGKLGDSFEAFVEIIEEIENAENPSLAQFSKFKNVGSIVNQALETWKESLQDRAGNAVADNMMAKIEQWASTIQAALAVATPTKATATSVKAEATAASKSYKRSNVIEKVLIAIKNGKNNASVDISTLLDDYCTNTDAVVLGAVRKVYLDGQSYLPTQIGCNTLINIVELSLSDDKTKIEGLNLRGDAADVEAIWNWLGIMQEGSLRIIDKNNYKRKANMGETLYLVRTALPSREVSVEWDSHLSGELAYQRLDGHEIVNTSSAANKKVYTSAIQTPLNHKSQFSLNGRNVNLEIVPQNKKGLGVKSPEFDITKYANMAIKTLEDYNLLTKQPTKSALQGANTGVNYYFQATLADIEELNKEEEDSRLAYKAEEAKNGLEIGVKANEDFPIPSLGKNFSFSVGSCNYSLKVGVFINVSATAMASTNIVKESKTYINNEANSSNTEPRLEAGIEVGMSVGLRPQAVIDLCDGPSVKFIVSGDVKGDVIKVSPPVPPSADWITFPILEDGVKIETSVKVEVRLNSALEFSYSWAGEDIVIKDLF